MHAVRFQLLAILLLLPALHVVQAMAAENAEPLAITHGPYLQGPRATSMTIVWFTNKKCISRVEFLPDRRCRPRLLVPITVWSTRTKRGTLCNLRG